MAMSIRELSFCFCLLVCFLSLALAAQAYELTRGRQLMIQNGLQIQSLVYPVGFSDIPLWESANFTAYNFWQWSNRAVIENLQPGQQWARQYETNYSSTKFLDWYERRRIDSLVRYQYGDELFDLLEPERLEDMAETYEQWRTLYPNAIVHTNVFADQYTPAEHATYMQVAQPDMVMFDNYPQFTFRSPSRDTWYSTMQTFRRAGLAGNDGTGNAPIPYAQFLRLYRDGYDQPKPSESYIRLQQFASWAFGYTLVDGFIYTHIESPVETLAAVMFDSDDDSAPNEVFDYVQETNRQSRNLGPALVRLLSTDVRMIRGRTGSARNSLPTGLSEWSRGTADTDEFVDYLTAVQPTVSEGGGNDVTHSDVLLGYFRPLLPEGDDYPLVNGLRFMIVNGAGTGTAAQSAQWYRLTFDFAESGFNSLLRLSRETGESEVVPLTHLGASTYSLDLNLPGGTGDLFTYWFDGLTGDYNRDGAVDVADYTVWRNTLHSTTSLAADGNRNGVIDDDDYTVWKSNFGAAAESEAGATVPEPSSLLAGLSTLLGIVLKCRRAASGKPEIRLTACNSIECEPGKGVA